jgi:hypothetical protein
VELSQERFDSDPSDADLRAWIEVSDPSYCIGCDLTFRLRYHMTSNIRLMPSNRLPTSDKAILPAAFKQSDFPPLPSQRMEWDIVPNRAQGSATFSAKVQSRGALAETWPCSKHPAEPRSRCCRVVKAAASRSHGCPSERASYWWSRRAHFSRSTLPSRL